MFLTWLLSGFQTCTLPGAIFNDVAYWSYYTFMESAGSGLCYTGASSPFKDHFEVVINDYDDTYGTTLFYVCSLLYDMYVGRIR